MAVSNVGSKAGYELWAGSVNVGALATGPLTVSVLGADGAEIDVAFF